MRGSSGWQASLRTFCHAKQAAGGQGMRNRRTGLDTREVKAEREERGEGRSEREREKEQGREENKTKLSNK